MKTKYHIQITHNALRIHFSKKALKTIILANINQDCLYFQLGHDHFHFDGSAFTKSYKYIALQHNEILENISVSNPKAARKALGRLIHTWQDFYSHSNYIQLWKDKTRILHAEEVIHDDLDIIEHPDLKSGNNYGLTELLATIPGISSIIKPFMPANSHAKMNLDSPKSGPDFYFAYWAAHKCTTDIYNQLQVEMRNNFSQDKIFAFTGKQSSEVKV